MSGISCFAQQDREARKVAVKVSHAFTHRLAPLDRQNLLNGKLYLTVENTGYGPDFEHHSFKSFTGLQRWIKKQETPQGIPWRVVGDSPIRCRRGLCTMSLLDGQMQHSHVFLTKMWYGRVNRRVYVRRLYIMYG